MACGICGEKMPNCDCTDSERALHDECENAYVTIAELKKEGLRQLGGWHNEKIKTRRLTQERDTLNRVIEYLLDGTGDCGPCDADTDVCGWRNCSDECDKARLQWAQEKAENK